MNPQEQPPQRPDPDTDARLQKLTDLGAPTDLANAAIESDVSYGTSLLLDRGTQKGLGKSFFDSLGSVFTQPIAAHHSPVSITYLAKIVASDHCGRTQAELILHNMITAPGDVEVTAERPPVISERQLGLLADMMGGTTAGTQKGSIALQVLEDVQRFHPGNEGTAIELISANRNIPSILERYFALMDTYDPWEAFERTQCIVPTAAVRREFNHDIASEVAEDSAETLPESVKLASGVVSTSDKIFLIYNRQATTQGMFLGPTATPHLLETISGDVTFRPSVEKKPESRAQRDRDLEQLGLEDLLKTPELAGEIGSPLIGRQLRVFQELQRETERLQRELKEQLPKGSYEKAAQLLRQLSISNDPGGMLVKRCEREFDSLPDTVQAAVVMLKDPSVRLDSGSRSACIKIVALHLIHRECVRSDVLVKAFESDYAAWKALPEADPLRVRHAELAPLADTFEQMKKDAVVLSMADVGRLLSERALLDFRKEHNQRIWQQWQAELEPVLDRFTPLFQDSGNWREDCIPLKVPNRLKETVYGAKLGVQPGTEALTGAAPQWKSALSRSDFSSLLQCLFITQAASDEAALYNSMPARDFSEAILGGVLAGRKAAALDAQLSRFYEPLQDSPDLTDIETSAVVCEQFRQAARPIVTGTLHKVGLLEELPVDVQQGLASVEYHLRHLPTSVTSDIRMSPDKLVVAREHDLFLQAGTFPRDFTGELCAIGRRLTELELTPRKMMRAELEAAERITRSEHFICSPCILTLHERDQLLAQDYFTEREVQALQELRAAEPEVEVLLAKWQGDNTALDERLKTLRSTRVYRGQRTPDGSLSVDSFYPINDNHERYIRDFNGVRFFDPEALDSLLSLLEKRIADRDFLPLAEVSDDWKARATALCSKEGAHLLARPVDDRTYQVGRQFLQAKSGYVTKELYAIVDSLAPDAASLVKRFSLPDATQRHLQIDEGFIRVSFGKHANSPLLQAAFDNPGYITDYITKQAFPEPVKEVCMLAHTTATQLKKSSSAGRWESIPPAEKERAEQDLRQRITRRYAK